MMGMECWQLALVHHSFWMAAALLVIVTALPFASKSCGSQRTLFLCAVPLQLYQTQLTALIVSLSIQKPPL